MTFAEKILYHQIHPAKLLTDVGTAAAAVYLLWRGQPLVAIPVAIIPSILISTYLIRYGDLERLRDSSAGRYMKSSLDSRVTDALRLGGFLVAAVGGWIQNGWLIFFGFFAVLMCWLHGLVFRVGHKTD